MWSDLKRLLSRLYVSVKSNNFIYFLKECEWRKKIANLKYNPKLDEIKFIFNHTAETVEFNLYEKNQFLDYNKDEYAYSEEDILFTENKSDENWYYIYVY